MKKIYIQPRIETVATTPQQILCTSGGIRAEISGYGKSSGGFTQMPVWLAGIICSSLLFLGTACSSNNPDQPKQQAELKPRTLIVTEVESQKSKVESRKTSSASHYHRCGRDTQCSLEQRRPDILPQYESRNLYTLRIHKPCSPRRRIAGG